MSQEDMNKIIFCTNDGQGDTDLDSIAELRNQYEEDEEDEEIKNMSNSEFIDYIYQDTNGNMTTCIYLDGSQVLTKIRFVD